MYRIDIQYGSGLLGHIGYTTYIIHMIPIICRNLYILVASYYLKTDKTSLTYIIDDKCYVWIELYRGAIVQILNA